MISNCEKLAKLKDIGFTFVGRWKTTSCGIECELSQEADSPNSLYAFAIDDQLMYIGKTTQTLRKRLAGYRKPSPTQATNVRNNKNIQGALASGKRVDVYIFRDVGLMNYGGFHLNVAAGLEDSLIVRLNPTWNGGKKDEPDEGATIPQLPPSGNDVTPRELHLPVGKQTSPRAIGEVVKKPGTADFAVVLGAMLADASRSGVPHLDVRAGDLHKKVGGYDDSNHRMMLACSIMRKQMQAGDEVLPGGPQKGNGANLRVRFFFPRSVECAERIV